jgi:hypothetical protein
MKKKNPAVKTLLVRNQVKNILNIFNQATDTEITNGQYWYLSAHQFCVGLMYAVQKVKGYHDIKEFNIAGIVAALSPGVNWDRNKMDATDLVMRYLVKGKKVNPYRYGTYPANIKKAEAIFKAKTVDEVAKIIMGKSGLKTHAFFHNIMLDMSNHVTVDRHAYKAANNIWEGGAVSMHAKRYKDTEQAYMLAQDTLKDHNEPILPAQLQAIVWLVYKRLNNHKTGLDVDYVEPF